MWCGPGVAGVATIGTVSLIDTSQEVSRSTNYQRTTIRAYLVFQTRSESSLRTMPPHFRRDIVTSMRTLVGSNQGDGWWPTKEAARLLGVSLRQLYQMIDEGLLPARKVGRRVEVLLGEEAIRMILFDDLVYESMLTLGWPCGPLATFQSVPVLGKAHGTYG